MKGGQASGGGMDDVRRVEGGACTGTYGHRPWSVGWAWRALNVLALLLTVLTLLVVEGLELQSFSYHLALFLDAGPVSFPCLPCFSQSELHGGEIIRVTSFRLSGQVGAICTRIPVQYARAPSSKNKSSLLANLCIK
eukprot:1152551-Pelagomonas_calceolata.AAC.3